MVIAGCGSASSGTVTREDISPAIAFSKYILALNAKNGALVCKTLDPPAAAKLRPPVKRESCAEGITASIGHPGPTGLRWQSAKLLGRPLVKGSGNTATVSVSVESTFRDKTTTGKSKREIGGTLPMKLVDRRWVLVQPDATLYFAIGQK